MPVFLSPSGDVRVRDDRGRKLLEKILVNLWECCAIARKTANLGSAPANHREGEDEGVGVENAE
jgi:hypothetical protein